MLAVASKAASPPCSFSTQPPQWLSPLHIEKIGPPNNNWHAQERFTKPPQTPSQLFSLPDDGEDQQKPENFYFIPPHQHKYLLAAPLKVGQSQWVPNKWIPGFFPEKKNINGSKIWKVLLVP